MKFILITLTSTIFIFSCCKSQEKNCLSQEDKQKAYVAIKKMMLENGVTPKNATRTYLTYDDISFMYWLDNNPDAKKYPHFNREIIVIEGGGVYYWLVYGDNKGNDKVSIETQDNEGCMPLNDNHPKEKTTAQKRIAQKTKEAEEHFCNILSKMNFDMELKISANEAESIVTKDAGNLPRGGYLHTELKNHYWHISTETTLKNGSKGDRNKFKYYIIDANNGNILLKLDDAYDPEQQKKLKDFLSTIKNK